MILAAFPTGVSNITVNGLHQWDYGQQMRIKAEDLPALIEVHFACAGMDEAVVRPCEVVNGEGTVTIPDRCLEQTSPVYAWIYEIDGTTGTTTKTILLNIIARARPQTGEGDIPIEIADKYTEAVTAMNEAVEQLIEGGVTVQRAREANHASTANNANFANEAEVARTTEDKGTLTDDLEENKGQTFSFSNTNGFGLKDGIKNGYFKLWNLLNPDDDKHYCSLVPSTDGKQSLGYSNRSFRRIFTNGLHVGGRQVFAAPQKCANGYVLPCQGFYYVSIVVGVVRMNTVAYFGGTEVFYNVEPDNSTPLILHIAANGTVMIRLDASAYGTEFPTDFYVSLLWKV